MNTLAQSTRQNKIAPTSSTSSLLVQRKCACGGASKLGGQCSECEKKKLVGDNAPVIQPKLKIGQPNDKYEQEADRVADEVMQMPEPKVQRQVKSGEEKDVIQRKTIASKITPLVQRQPAEEDKHKQGAAVSLDFRPKSNKDEVKEGLKKTGEALTKTELGKKIVGKGKELPGTVIIGAAATATVSALFAMNKKLPIQAPAIPLDRLHPGLSMKITVEGPLRAPTKAMISFSGKFGLPKRQRRQKPVKTESEKLREENVRMQRERESLRTPEEKARDNKMLIDQMSKRLAIPGLKSQEDAPLIEKKKEETTIQRKEMNNSAEVGADTSMVREVTQSAGQPLDVATRGFMEQRFGHDFSQVRIHNSGKAKESANAVNAKAYTVGQNIVFGSGHYAPGTRTGNRLLSHELTHVLQQCARGDLSMIQRVPNKSSQSMDEAAIPLATQKPDETFAAKFKRLRAGCIKDGSIVVNTSIDKNDSDMATGKLEVTYEGEGRTKHASDRSQKSLFPSGKIQRNENKKICFCDCIHYRQYIRGLGWTGLEHGSANRPILEFRSYNIMLPLDGQWHEELMPKHYKGINQDCNREFKDTPGWTENAKENVPIMLRYNLYLQIWDACQQRELWHNVRTLTVGGSMPPRSILWSSYHQPLTRESISTIIPKVNERPEIE